MEINWQKLALNLRKHKPLTYFSLQLGKHQNWLAQVAREGTEPKFSDGIKLLDLHIDWCGLENHKLLVKNDR